MPNHCHNRVTFYSDNTADVEKLKKMFEDENTFTQIIPEPCLLYTSPSPRDED